MASIQRIDLRFGDWQRALAKAGNVDAIITDPPYGERTHGGQRHGRRQHNVSVDKLDWSTSRGLGYDHLSSTGVRAFVDAWAPRCHGWFCVFTSHDLVPHWEARLRRHDRYVFKPLAVVMRGMNVRLAGDGPSSWSVNLVVARPKHPPYSKWGTLPGAYVGHPFDSGENTATASRKTNVVGSKPIWLMRAIVRDYTRPGDLVCDPCAGSGSTLLAAAIEGRYGIGAEMDPDTHAAATARIGQGYTPDMFSGMVAE
jgi:site-specific DNA-methyltransferase (adenine-specific)